MNQQEPDFRQDFITDTREQLALLESLLVDYESRILKGEQLSIDEIFRILHTIKGNSVIFGFTAIEEFTHNVESLCATIRAEKLPISARMTTKLLEAHDVIRHLVDSGEAGDKELDTISEKVLEDLTKITHQAVREKTEPAAGISAEGGSRPIGSGLFPRKTSTGGGSNRRKF